MLWDGNGVEEEFLQVLEGSNKAVHFLKKAGDHVPNGGKKQYGINTFLIISRIY